jgi:predicted CXXCH cytochrome family protein
MKKKWPLLLILIFISGSVIIAYTLRESAHEFSEVDCPKCHVDAANAPLTLTAPITELCRPCHKKTINRASHPVDRAPELVRVPEDLPLDNGLITCNTCHNIHENRYNGIGGMTYFLRRPSAGRDFCMSCHEVRSGSNMHIELVAAAHIGSKFKVIDRSQPLDPLSVECIYCHDGSIGKNVDAQTGSGIWQHNNSSHPIGVNYNESRMRKGGLHPFSMIDKRIRLFSGKIGCGTCHNMYSGLPMQLVMSNEGSSLCMWCHDK